MAAATEKEIRAALAASGIESAAFEARQLARFAEEKGLSADALVAQRTSGEPLQYILGEWEFYSLPFLVGDGVLIPRPDTETLADLAIEFVSTRTAECIDLCSGSGCLAVTLAKHCKNATVTALEKSEKAFAFLKKNIAQNGVDVKAVLGDVTQPPTEKYDLIISNPPYIKRGDLSTLQREVRREPQMALDGGEDGLFFYRVIAQNWIPALRRGGMLAVEIGAGQEDDVRAIFSAAGLKNIGEKKDLGGIVRVIFGTPDDI